MEVVEEAEAQDYWPVFIPFEVDVVAHGSVQLFVVG